MQHIIDFKSGKDKSRWTLFQCPSNISICVPNQYSITNYVFIKNNYCLLNNFKLIETLLYVRPINIVHGHLKLVYMMLQILCVICRDLWLQEAPWPITYRFVCLQVYICSITQKSSNMASCDCLALKWKSIPFSFQIRLWFLTTRMMDNAGGTQ